MSAREERLGATDVRPRQSASAPAPPPTGWRRLFHRPRMLAEAGFALGAALVMAAAGTAVALGMPPIRLLPTDEPAVRWFVQVAVGFGLGWWGGLFWGIGLVFYARRIRPLPPVAALMPATACGAPAVAAVALASRALGAPVILSIGAGVVAGTVAARLFVSRAARTAGR